MANFIKKTKGQAVFLIFCFFLQDINDTNLDCFCNVGKRKKRAQQKGGAREKKTRQKQRFIVILKCNALHKWAIHKVRQHFFRHF